MHYFIIHAGKDDSVVQQLMEKWSAEHSRFKGSILKGTQMDWHDDARAQIRGAQKVIYIVGATSSVNENIDWELGVAIEENKEIYVCKLDPSYSLNKVIANSNKNNTIQSGETNGELIFSHRKHNIFITDTEDIENKLTNDDNYIATHIDASLQENLDIALKQYEIFVGTSEELVRRKQNVNSFYITLNSLIISVILAAFALSSKIDVLGHTIATASIIICLSTFVGGIVCFSWHSVLQSYADLNSSKMTIIAYIESQLAYNLYDTEWQLVSKKMGNRKYKSFTKKEKFIAKLFIGLYVILFVVGICFALI